MKPLDSEAEQYVRTVLNFYQRHKMQPFAGKKVTPRESPPASVQRDADPDDR